MIVVKLTFTSARLNSQQLMCAKTQQEKRRNAILSLHCSKHKPFLSSSSSSFLFYLLLLPNKQPIHLYNKKIKSGRERPVGRVLHDFGGGEQRVRLPFTHDDSPTMRLSNFPPNSFELKLSSIRRHFLAKNAARTWKDWIIQTLNDWITQTWKREMES